MHEISAQLCYLMVIPGLCLSANLKFLCDTMHAEYSEWPVGTYGYI